MNTSLACQNAVQLAETITDEQICNAATRTLTADQIAAVRTDITQAINMMPDCDMDTFATDPRPQQRLLIMTEMLYSAVRSVLQL